MASTAGFGPANPSSILGARTMLKQYSNPRYYVWTYRGLADEFTMEYSYDAGITVVSCKGDYASLPRNWGA